MAGLMINNGIARADVEIEGVILRTWIDGGGPYGIYGMCTHTIWAPAPYRKTVDSWGEDGPNVARGC